MKTPKKTTPTSQSGILQDYKLYLQHPIIQGIIKEVRMSRLSVTCAIKKFNVKATDKNKAKKVIYRIDSVWNNQKCNTWGTPTYNKDTHSERIYIRCPYQVKAVYDTLH